ncbi:MAG: hypothetical protein WAV40_04415 [Microgenomates group bacterium]
MIISTQATSVLYQTICPAILTKKLEGEIKKTALAAYRAIGCLDFGRVDLRLGSADKVSVMEINHSPGLMSDINESSFFTIAGHAAGLTFPQMMRKIIDSAISRLHI